MKSPYLEQLEGATLLQLLEHALEMAEAAAGALHVTFVAAASEDSPWCVGEVLLWKPPSEAESGVRFPASHCTSQFGIHCHAWFAVHLYFLSSWQCSPCNLKQFLNIWPEYRSYGSIFVGRGLQAAQIYKA